MSTYIADGKANVYFEWHRPRDAPGNGFPSCIDEYRVEVLAVSATHVIAGTRHGPQPQQRSQQQGEGILTIPDSELQPPKGLVCKGAAPP